jgi:hypothetical protein
MTRAICTVPTPTTGYQTSKACALQGVQKKVTSLNGTDIDSFGTFRACTTVEGYPLVFGKTLETSGLNIPEVGEQVVAALVRFDKAEALGIVKPFYCSGLRTHEITFRYENAACANRTLETKKYDHRESDRNGSWEKSKTGTRPTKTTT